MSYFIWYSEINGIYDHGTEMDIHVQESLTGENLIRLYELEESELFLVKKIVAQLNVARVEQEQRSLV